MSIQRFLAAVILLLAIAATARSQSNELHPCHLSRFDAPIPMKYELPAKEADVFLDKLTYYWDTDPGWLFKRADDVADDIYCIKVRGRFAVQLPWARGVLLVQDFDEPSRYFIVRTGRKGYVSPHEATQLWLTWATSAELMPDAGGGVVELVGEFGGIGTFFPRPLLQLRAYRASPQRGVLVQDAQLFRWSYAGGAPRAPEEWLKYFATHNDQFEAATQRVDSLVACGRRPENCVR